MLAWLNEQGRRVEFSHPELQDLRAQSRTFAGLAAYRDTAVNISDDRAMAEEISGAWVTANLFGLLREQPLLGRDFSPDDDRRGAEPVAIVGYRLWQQRYGGDPTVLGRTLRVNGQPATIVGVMPDRMRFPEHTQVWVPFVPTDAQEQRHARILSVFGRLTDGAAHDEAQAELSGIARQLATAYPDAHTAIIGIRVETFSDAFVGGLMRRMFITIMAAVVFVLLIACANVANLLLSRSVHRAREIAVRMAMGATRWRVVRQLLLESVVFGLIGGSLGLLLTFALVRGFDAAMADAGGPYWVVYTMDGLVFGYVAAIGVGTAVVFGLAPALHVSNRNNHEVLKEGARGSVGSRRVRWFSGAMVVAELALTIVLLAGAGLMIRSFIKLYAVDIGIDIDRLMAMSLRLPESKYARVADRRAFFEQLEPRVAAIPGVEAVAVTTGVPPLDGGERLLEIDGLAGASAERPASSRPRRSARGSSRSSVSRSFAAARSRTRTGRPAPRPSSSTSSWRHSSFPGKSPSDGACASPSGRPHPAQPPDVWRTIVGISPSIRQGSPQDLYISAVVYVPYRQDAPGTASLLVRSALAPGSVMDAVRREVQALDRDQPVFTIQTVEQLLSAERWPLRVFGSLFAVFAVIALVLSAVGLYAVMAYSVTERTQEIGVRMAVGAQPRHVWWLILRRALMQLAIGVPLGLAGALALGVVLQRMLVDMTPGDPFTFAGITALLAVVAIAACLLPARRAARVDPMVALRIE